MTDSEQTVSREWWEHRDDPDFELLGEVETGIGDRVEVWRVKFSDPFPVRLLIHDDDGQHCEAWLDPATAAKLAPMLEGSRS